MSRTNLLLNAFGQGIKGLHLLCSLDTGADWLLCWFLGPSLLFDCCFWNLSSQNYSNMECADVALSDIAVVLICLSLFGAICPQSISEEHHCLFDPFTS